MANTWGGPDWRWRSSKESGWTRTSPVGSFPGNSGGDREMLEWAAAGEGPTLALLVDHDDAEREFAYVSSAETVAEPEPITDVAARAGWTVASMARDWEVVFGSWD